MANPPSSIEHSIAEVENNIEATYLNPCVWRESDYKITEPTPKAALIAEQEMRIDFYDCFIRHNGLIKELNK